MKNKMIIIILIFLFVFPISSNVFSYKSLASEETSALGVYTYSSNIIAQPSVIIEYSSEIDLNQFSGRVSSSMIRPATMIVEIDENCNVIKSNDNIAFKDFYSNYLKDKMLTVVRVESDAAASAFTNYLKINGYIDIAVVSSDIELVKKVREDNPYIRGIIDYSETDISLYTCGKLAEELNKHYALTAILSLEQATSDFVFGLQGRFKSAWVKISGNDDFQILSAISSGAVGIINDDYKNIYSIYDTFNNTTLSRKFYDIAHRGMAYGYAENSLEGCIAAFEKGATHIEIDAKICKSGEIVIMHDDDISRTTNGSGSIYNYTLSELNNFKITKDYKGTSVEPCKIPTLEEIFNYFKDKDLIIIVEIKNEQSDFVEKFKSLIEKCDISEQVVSISFSRNQLKAMKQTLPEIPTADLNDISKNDYITNIKTLCSNNSAIDPSKSSIGTARWLFNNSFSRGFLPYYWTQDSIEDTKNVVYAGCMGITNNYPESLSSFAKNVYDTGNYKIKNIMDDEIDINIELYDSKEKTVKAKVLAYKMLEDYAECILQYVDNDLICITTLVKIYVEKNDDSENINPEPGDNSDNKEPGDTSQNQTQNKGCKSTISTDLCLVIFISTLIYLIKFKLKKINK